MTNSVQKVKKKNIINLTKSRRTIRDIADLIISIKSEKRGQKCKTMAHFDHLLVRQSKMDPFSSPNNIIELLNTPVTSRTNRNRLREADLTGRSA